MATVTIKVEAIDETESGGLNNNGLGIGKQVILGLIKCLSVFKPRCSQLDRISS